MKKFEIKKILVPTDFSDTAANALKQAISIAKVNHASIKLIHAVNSLYTTGSELTVPNEKPFLDKIQKSALLHLKTIAGTYKLSSGIDITYDVIMGGVEKVINTTASKEKFSLIIMGTHGTTGAKEFFIGSNAYKVVHNSSCPVITIQKKIKNGFKNIILPIRLGLHSRQKVDYVVELAKIFGSTIHITGFTSDRSKESKDKVKQYVKQVEKYLADQKLQYTSTTIFENNFTKEILAHAHGLQADLIAIMNDNDFSLDQLVTGPYAKQFVNHSDIPVLSVPVKQSTNLSYSPYLSGVSPI
ncbi:MAG: universal stress protein UspE [Bacteroidetes bacterium]|nr:universal stress protein UspE [Bacteroidota bacterium]